MLSDRDNSRNALIAELAQRVGAAADDQQPAGSAQIVAAHLVGPRNQFEWKSIEALSWLAQTISWRP